MTDSTVQVTFSGDASQLKAATAAASAQVAALNNQIAAFRTTTNATTLGIAGYNSGIAALRAQAASAQSELATLQASVASVGGPAANASHGIGGITRELIVLGHEASQGRYTRLGGSLMVMAEYATPMATAFIAANPAIAAVGAAALVAAAAIGYLAYQSFETSKAIKGIEFDAARNQFISTKEAATELVTTVEKMGNVGGTDARAFIEPFLALGPVGEAISAVASQYLPAFIANGRTAKEAGEELAKAFVNISKGGAEGIANSRMLSEEEKRTALAFVAAGDKVQAYQYVLAILARSMSGLTEEQAKAKAATDALDAQMAIAASGGENFAGAEELLSRAIGDATAKTQAQEEELGRWMLKAAMATDQAGRLSAAMTDALKVDKITAGIQEAEGKVREFQDALGSTKDPESITQLNRSLEITQDHLKKLRDEASGGLLGGSALERIKEQNRAIDEQNQGPRSSQLQSELPALQAAAANQNLPEQERVKAAQDASAMILKIRDAEFEETKAKDDERVIEAGKNSAQVIAIRQKEVADAVRAYGEGNAKTVHAEEELARAKEQAANRGAAAGAKAAKDELGATMESLNTEISEAEKTTSAKIALFAKEAQVKQITEKQKVALTLAALKEGEDAELAAVNKEADIGNLSLKQAQAIADKKKNIELDYSIAVAKIEEDAAAKSAQAWQSATNSINSAFDSQINGLLTGTENWHTAFKNVIKDLTEQLIKMGVNTVLSGAENSIGSGLGIPGANANAGLGSMFAPMLAALGLNTTATTAHTAATTVSTGATTVGTGAATLNTGATALNTGATTLGNANATVGNAVTATNTAANTANTVATLPNTAAILANNAIAAVKAAIPFLAEGTPFVGKTGLAVIHEGEAVIPAAKNPFGRMGMPSFDVGAWNIPSDMTAMVHRGEMIPTASQSAGLRSLIEGGGSGGAGGGRSVNINPTVHFGVSSIDGASTAQWMRDNQHEMLKAINGAVRQGAHLGMRRLTA